MFGAAGLRAAAFAGRRFGVRCFDNPALRGERGLRAMILPPRPGASMPWPAGKSHAAALLGLRFACGKAKAN
jgi:hypothetical protein